MTQTQDTFGQLLISFKKSLEESVNSPPFRVYEEYRGKSYQTKHSQYLDRQAQKVPRLVKWLTRFQKPDDRCVGDTLERLLAGAGGRRFKHLMHLMHLPCGCDDRQRWLSERYPYS